MLYILTIFSTIWPYGTYIGNLHYKLGTCPSSRTCQEEENIIKKEKKKNDTLKKAKDKKLAYKLQHDIQKSTNMKSILEQKFLDAKVEFSLREALDIV